MFSLHVLGMKHQPMIEETKSHLYLTSKIKFRSILRFSTNSSLLSHLLNPHINSKHTHLKFATKTQNINHRLLKGSQCLLGRITKQMIKRVTLIQVSCIYHQQISNSSNKEGLFRLLLLPKEVQIAHSCKRLRCEKPLDRGKLKNLNKKNYHLGLKKKVKRKMKLIR